MCSRERPTGSNESACQSNKRLAENGEYISNSDQAEHSEVIGGSCIENLIGLMFASSLYSPDLSEVCHRTDGFVLIL